MSDPAASTRLRDFVFGTSGVPRSLGTATHIDGIREVSRLGLGAMELAFVRQVNVRREAAPAVREASIECGVRLSAHASYFINFNSPEPDKVVASANRLLSAARIGWLCGADAVVFHAGWRHDHAPGDTYAAIRDRVREIAHELHEEGVGIRLMPETTGKLAQFGNLDELLMLAHDVPGVEPCIDFAHLHAREGLFNTEGEFDEVLTQASEALGPEALRRLHLHVSGIHYGPRGELKHLPFAEADFDYMALLGVLARRGAAGRIICESPINDQDALVLQSAWAALVAQV